MKRTIIITIAAISIVMIGFYFFAHSGNGIPVKLISVEKGEIASTLNATGKVLSREEAGISSPLAAQVKMVYADEGVQVEKGALLALLNDRELTEKMIVASETLREADEKVRQMKKSYDSLTVIYAAGGISKQSVDEARSNLKMARAAAKRSLAEKRGAAIVLDRLKIVAPFAGIITKREINPGEWVTPGAITFSLAKEHQREFEITVDESDTGLIRIGQGVTLTSEAFPGRSWQETVVKVATAVRREEAASSIKIRVSYGSAAPDLKLGQQVDAKIRIAYRADAVKVPFDALINKNGKTFVAAVQDGVIRYMPVVTGVEDTVSVEIVKGIAPGQEIIRPEGKIIEEGSRVSTINREQPLR